jgi:serine/threonine-protein kinase
MIGKQLLHYKIVDKIGEGGMGVVYKAEDTRLDRTVALKFMPPDLSNDPASKERFIREAQTIAALDHPNLCTIHAIEESDDGRLFIAMACYDGETLGKKIEAGPLDIGEAVAIAVSVAEGMRSAHAKGIIHRDIKPANVFLVNDGPVKVVDFGLAKWFGKSSMTRSGVTLGTVAYMSPEQTRGDNVDALTDVWALGVVLYEALAGRRPFDADYDQAVVYSISNENPDPVSRIRPDIPAELERIVTRALSKDPDDRFQSAEEMMDALQDFHRSGASTMETESSPGVAPPSIAVLPFVNMSSDPENEYFGDGLAEELINALAGVKGLKVAARTSAFRFRGGEQDVREIGRKLSVNTILEGSVRKAGDTLRVTAQLIDAADGFHIWSQRFDRHVDDIFAIQDEITDAIVDRLRVQLAGAPGTPLVKRYTDDLGAYNLFLKGRYYWNQFSPDGWDKAIQCFDAALERDPTFALAYIGVAMYHQASSYWGETPPSRSFPLAKEAAEKALALDETMADAHGVLAVYAFSHDWDFDAADREFERTLELDPGLSLHHVNIAVFSMTRKRFDKAVSEADVASRLDPLSPVIRTWAAMVPAYVGRPQESIEQLERASELDPNYWQPYYHTAIAHVFLSDYNEAAASAEKAVDLSGGAPVALAGLAAAHYLAGRKDDGDVVFDRLEKKSEDTYVPATFLVWVHLAKGDTDAAYHCLERAVDDRDPWLLFCSIMPGPLKSSDTRFAELLTSAGLLA